MEGKDEYILENTYHFPNAVVRVHRPVLTEEEREQRMEQFKKATAKFLMDGQNKKEEATA